MRRSVAFNPAGGLVVVRVRLWGPSGDTYVRLALDTGATTTMVRNAVLVSLGYDPTLAPRRVQMTTGSGVEFVVRLRVSRISALGRSRRNFPVLGHTLPPSATVDGLLGLDFFRRSRLEINFRKGFLQLAA